MTDPTPGPGPIYKRPTFWGWSRLWGPLIAAGPIFLILGIVTPSLAEDLLGAICLVLGIIFALIVYKIDNSDSQDSERSPRGAGPNAT